MLDPELRAKAVALVRDGNPVMAMRTLQDKAGLRMVDCKALVSHITRKKGSCLRCKKPLSGDEQTVCENCKSLNLDW